MYSALQMLATGEIDPMNKMWLSFVGIGLMVVAALLITFARKKKGWVRVVWTLIAIIMLIYGFVCGMLSII